LSDITDRELGLAGADNEDEEDEDQEPGQGPGQTGGATQIAGELTLTKVPYDQDSEENA